MALSVQERLSGIIGRNVFLAVMISAYFTHYPALAGCYRTVEEGATLCTGDPNTFPNGGAVNIGIDAGNPAAPSKFSLQVRDLTGDISPNVGIAGAAVTSTPATKTQPYGQNGTNALPVTADIEVNSFKEGLI